MEVTLIYRFIGKSGANPSKNVFERKKIGQVPLETVSSLNIYVWICSTFRVFKCL